MTRQSCQSTRLSRSAVLPTFRIILAVVGVVRRPLPEPNVAPSARNFTLSDPPMTPQLRKSPRVTRPRVLLLLAAILALTTGAAWPVPKPTVGPVAGDALVRTHGPQGPVHIEQMSTTLIWPSTGSAAVSMELSNTSGSPQVIQAWWLLAKVGTKQVWINPVVHSLTVNETIPAHATRTIKVMSLAQSVRMGTYGLSGWVHYLEAGSFRHSDGRSIGSAISVVSVHTTVANASTELGNFVATTDYPKTWVAQEKQLVQVRVVNPTTEPRPVRLWVTIDPVGMASKPTQASAAATVVIPQAQSQLIDLGVTPTDGSGARKLHVWIADEVLPPLQPSAHLMDTADIRVR